MPIYEYQCQECDHQLEVMQRMSDDRLTTCPSCGKDMKVIGATESFRIEWVPGHFVRYDIARDKCACPKCPAQGVLTAPGPFALDRSMAGNGLVARVLVDKFADHIPANRDRGRRPFARQGRGQPQD